MTSNKKIAELGPISDAIAKLAEEKRKAVAAAIAAGTETAGTDMREFTFKVAIRVDPRQMSPFWNNLSERPNGPTFGNLRNSLEYYLLEGVEKFKESNKLELVQCTSEDCLTIDDPGDGITGQPCGNGCNCFVCEERKKTNEAN